MAGAVACLASPVPAAHADVGTGAVGEPGGAGIGDPHFPLLGNDSYDVRHYDRLGRGRRHIWLNEGFASYAQYLWTEHLPPARIANRRPRLNGAA